MVSRSTRVRAQPRSARSRNHSRCLHRPHVQA